MVNKKLFNELLNKSVDRKQFLQIVGAALLGMVGFTAFIKNLDKFAGHHTGKKPVSGYGASPYGR